MGKIKLNLRNMTVTEKLQFARQIVSSMTGNANFTTPDPALTVISTSADSLEKAYNDANVARQDASAKASTQDDMDSALDTVLAKLANYVENASDSDETKILSAGMSLRAKPTPVGALAAPAALAATACDKEGEIDLSWDRVTGSKSYVVEQSPDPITSASWKQVTISTKSNVTASGLVSGMKYWFRVSGIGAAGQGPWSDPATKYAP